jgi:hypothetical protein
MAPYTPPTTHYSQMDVSEYDEDQVFAFVGKTGKRFYWLTKKLDLITFGMTKSVKSLRYGVRITHTSTNNRRM